MHEVWQDAHRKKMDMKTSLITFEWFHDKKDVGSSRIRATSLLKYWKDAELMQDGKKYDVEIYQKVYWSGRMKKSPSIKIIDICDPDWARRPEKMYLNEIIANADAFTFPTEKYLDYFSAFFPNKPMMVIPDRVDLSEIKQIKKHEGKAKGVVWFGYSHNAGVLKQAIPTLKHMNLKLTIISDDMRIFLGDLAEKKLFNFIKYNPNTVYNDIVENGDIVLLPPHSIASGGMPYAAKFKSNNKTVTSWACGMPVATNAEELEYFLKEENRIKDQKEKLALVKEKYDIKLSVLDYLNLISKIS